MRWEGDRLARNPGRRIMFFFQNSETKEVIVRKKNYKLNKKPASNIDFGKTHVEDAMFPPPPAPFNNKSDLNALVLIWTFVLVDPTMFSDTKVLPFQGKKGKTPKKKSQLSCHTHAQKNKKTHTSIAKSKQSGACAPLNSRYPGTHVPAARPPPARTPADVPSGPTSICSTCTILETEAEGFFIQPSLDARFDLCCPLARNCFQSTSSSGPGTGSGSDTGAGAEADADAEAAPPRPPRPPAFSFDHF